ncbi:MAG: beta-N-acetylglucosaminidase [Cyclobacteriaceae bacterium]|nr:MAG: beta-N-acetylglucosaminidase [Cyclobacteriaceae bacterium]
MNVLRLNYNPVNNSTPLKVGLSGLLLLVIFSSIQAQPGKIHWVDSVFSTLTLDEKIGQLFFISVNPYDDEDKKERDLEWIRHYGIGGVIVNGGGPNGVRKWLNRLQQEARVPLLAGINAEEGPGITLDSAHAFPPILSLAAIHQDSLLFFMGQAIARQLNQAGLHFNLAPATNPSGIFNTPDLYYHAWGSDPRRIASKAALYAAGLRYGGVLPVAKHIPYYGLQIQQYQKGTPVFAPQRLDEATQVIFSKINPWCSGVLLSYEHDPSFTTRKTGRAGLKTVAENFPLLFSAEWLKKNTAFNGLAFSYLPDLKDVLKKERTGDAEWYALLAGNNVLLEPRQIPLAVRRLRRQFKKTPKALALLDESVKKILGMKYDAGLAHQATPQIPQPFRTEAETKILTRKLTEQSLVVLVNRDSLLPLQQLDQLNIAVLLIGAPRDTPFLQRLSAYAPLHAYHLQLPGDTTGLISSLRKHNLIIAGLYPYAAPVLDLLPELLNQLSPDNRVVVCNFSSPEKLPGPLQVAALVQAWTDSPEAQHAAAGALFGSFSCNGTMPIDAGSYQQGAGVTTPKLDILYFAEPEEAGMKREVLNKIDRIAREAIDERAAPGCQIAVIRHGKVVYHRSFGWLTYSRQTPVNQNTLYDLASVTKVAATLQAIMFLYEKGALDIYKKVSVYLPEMERTNKKDIIIKDVLTHQAGLVPFEPWYPLTMKDTTLLHHYYSRMRSEKYPLQVAPRLFAAPHIRDSIWQWTLRSPMLPKPPRTPYPFRYSDLSFIILHRLAEKLLNQPLEDFVRQNLYDPLGASALGFNPLTYADSANIAPTEYDKTFRKQWVVGTVHDERAAMLGGVAGHAGLFGNAINLAKLGQMLLQQGRYAGLQFYKPETVQLFTRRQFETSRRGLGWDKPLLGDFTGPTSLYASPKTFGHTGFTGTCIWVDPEFDLVYVFLSNRVHPDRSNKLIQLNIRSRIQDVIYQSIFEYCAAPNPLPWNRLE